MAFFSGLFSGKNPKSVSMEEKRKMGAFDATVGAVQRAEKKQERKKDEARGNRHDGFEKYVPNQSKVFDGIPTMGDPSSKRGGKKRRKSRRKKRR